MKSGSPIVVIDARMVGPTPHGFARYVTRLAEGLLELRQRQGGLEYRPVFLVSAYTMEPVFARFETRVVHSPFLNPAEQAEIPWTLRSLGAALYHSPTFSSLAWSPCPWVVTVHDLNHLTYGGPAEKLYYRALLRRFVRGAKKVLTVSEFSRAELARWAGIPAESIEIAWNALDPAAAVKLSDVEVARVLDRFKLKRGEYFLSLSNTKPHKNIPALVQGYRIFRNDPRISEAGGNAWPLVLSMKGIAEERGVLAVGSLPDYEGRALLQGAGALVFPSLYEGFGLPPVEAASLGIPAVVSRIPAHQEALAELGDGAGARWVDEPQDPRSWAGALGDAMRGLVAPAPEAARERIRARFHPFRLGSHMDQVYRHVLGVEK